MPNKHIHTRSNEEIFKTRPNQALHNFMKKIRNNDSPTLAETNYFLFLKSYMKHNGNIKKICIDLNISERNARGCLVDYGFIEEE